MRIAIIGNSHLSALKNGLGLFDDDLSTQNIELVFYGTPLNDLSKMTYSDHQFHVPDKKLVKIVSDGKYTSLPVDDFDVVVFHGLIRSVSVFSRRLGAVKMHQDETSDAFLASILKDFLEMMPIIDAMRSVRKERRAAVFIADTPMFSETSKHLRKLQLSDENFMRLNTINSQLYEEEGFVHIPQRVETITKNKYTKQKFMSGSLRLTGDDRVEHPESDDAHANALFGKMVLEDILAKARMIVTNNENGPLMRNAVN